MLYAPDECVVHSTEHWRRFQNKRELILSKVARHSYKGYIAKELKEFTRGPKQGAHIARLLFTANTIATQGIVRVRLHDAELAIVRNIRAGKISLESVVTLAEQGMAKLDELFKSATILEVSDVKKVKEKVLDIKKEYFKRYDNTRRYSEDIQTPDV